MPAQLLFSHRGVLALQAGAVEAQCSDAGRAAWDVEKALVPSLTRLWLRQVPCGQGDGLHHTHWHIDVGRWQDLWAVLRTAKHWLSWAARGASSTAAQAMGTHKAQVPCVTLHLGTAKTVVFRSCSNQAVAAWG